MRRGRVPDLLLAALVAGPAHGYELMDRLEQFSGGSWRPSPGSVYPLLQLFEERGWVESQESDGRRIFALTEAGREQASQRKVGEFKSGFPFDSLHSQLRNEIQQLRVAGHHVAATATPAQMDQAVAIVSGARQALYRLLAEQ
jgi:DNA-binding PadR family transcriptional regulator